MRAPVSECSVDVRRRLAERTKLAHEALHDHPRIARLLSPQLTEAQYTALLAAFCSFFVGVEQRRWALHAWPELSLDRPIARMRQDLGQLGRPEAPLSTPELPQVSGPLACLGFLYVLHGSAFGGPVLAKRVGRSLPAAPRGYLSAKLDLDQWRRLTAALDEAGRAPNGFGTLAAAADQAFVLFGQWVTSHREVAVERV